jgi:tetratricopeptide (TPR) repeat protein
MAKKVENRTEILESSEALAEKLQGAETWMERHPKTVVGVAVAVALLVGGYFGFQYWVDNQNAAAQKEMFQAIRYFESDSLKLAINGDGNNLGLKDIVSDYKFTDAANLASYYAGVAYLKLGQFELARLYLQDFSSNDLLVQARAYSLLGDTYMEENNFSEAAGYYQKAADYKPNKFFTPGYLMKAALAYEKNNQVDKAKEAYDKIINDYWESSEFQNARKLKARLDGNA